MVATQAVSTERRTHVRFPANELTGLRSARVKYGQPITVPDLSAGGVRFETTAPLTHEATIVLEFSGPARTVLIPSRVVRCRNVTAMGYAVRSQGACAFKRLLGLKDLVTGPTSTLNGQEDTGLASWQPVVVKYRDGRLFSGYTSDFNASKTSLHVSPARSTDEHRYLEFTDLDALFFLEDPQGTDGRDADRVRERGTPYGRRVALMLPSGEELTGSTLNFNRHGSGVFVYPYESDLGVTRVFVTAGGLRNLRLL